jgi:DNA-binding response OmpR family regulator
MHILYVEDEVKIAEFVQAGLKEQGFLVDYCDNGNDRYKRALELEYDVIVLDIRYLASPWDGLIAHSDRAAITHLTTTADRQF